MKKFLFIFLFLPLFVLAQDDSPRHDTLILDRFFNFIGKVVDVKNFHCGVGLSTGLTPNLKQVHYQKESLYYGGGLNLNYYRSKKYSVNLDATLLNSRKYYEEIRQLPDFYSNQWLDVLFKRDYKFIMFTANINFKYNLLRRNFYYYVKTGMEMTSTAYRYTSTIVESIDTTLYYSTSYTCKEQFTNLFHFTNKYKPEKPCFGLTISPGINFTPLKKLKSFAEIEFKFYPRHYIEYVFLRKFSFGLNIGFYI
jgi:hypothetical protein